MVLLEVVQRAKPTFDRDGSEKYRNECINSDSKKGKQKRGARAGAHMSKTGSRKDANFSRLSSVLNPHLIETGSKQNV
jgi:hypothetical protein